MFCCSIWGLHMLTQTFSASARIHLGKPGAVNTLETKIVLWEQKKYFQPGNSTLTKFTMAWCLQTSLRNEVKALQDMVDNHPDVKKVQMENQTLKAEVRRVQSQRSVEQIDQIREAELERLFQELEIEKGLLCESCL